MLFSLFLFLRTSSLRTFLSSFLSLSVSLSLLLVLSFSLSFFLFVYIGREYTCIYVDMRIAFRLVWRRADMLILQLWVDRIV